VIYGRLGSVQILRAIAIENPCSEANGISPEIEDREHDPASEPIDNPASLRPTCKTGLLHGVISYPEVAKMGHKLLPTLGRISERELCNHITVVSAGAQISPGRSGIAARLEAIRVERNGE